MAEDKESVTPLDNAKTNVLNFQNDQKTNENLKQASQPIGKIAHELLQKGDQKQGVVDTQREVDKEYYSEIEKCVSSEPCKQWKEPFYVVVLHKREQLLVNVVRRYFLGRRSLPTPNYDQTVWRYYPSTGNLEFIWCIPDKNTALWMYDNPNQIPADQKFLSKFVFDFINCSLYSSVLKKYPEHNKEIKNGEKVSKIYTA